MERVGRIDGRLNSLSKAELLELSLESPLLDAIQKLARSQILTREESKFALLEIMGGDATAAQISAFVSLLRVRGETVEEVTGFVEAMRANMVSVSPKRRPLLDTCGTGGSALRVFNVSTTAAFAAASVGIGIAKHGNRAMSGVSGSADVLEALGANLSLDATQLAHGIDAVGIAFLFAPKHHPAMRHVSSVRKEIGFRTIFNLLGPLTNPADAELRVMGVYDPKMLPLAANVLLELGVTRAIVAHGEAGLVEISTIGKTLVSELQNGRTETYELTPKDLGVTGPEPSSNLIAPSPDPQENASFVRQALTGKDDSPASRARRDLTAVNLAASLRVAGKCETWLDAVEMAQEILSSGSGLETLENFVKFGASHSDSSRNAN